jgi:hypothetical protein
MLEIGSILWSLLFGFAFLQAHAHQALPPPAVWTAEYDNDRSAANLSETILTTANVNKTQFGLLFTLPVDDFVYAQPLYVPGLTVNGGVHNVVFAATLNNSVYAFDADTSGAPLWQVNLGPAAALKGNRLGYQCGILSTPVIDTSSNTIYVVPLTYESGVRIFRLHALDITTGQEKFSGPVLIQGSVPGSAPDAHNGMVTFNAAVQYQRPALLLVNSTVGVMFGTVNESKTYHGWAMSYDAGTLQQTGVTCTTPSGDKGGIWMSGRGPAADSNGAYVMTGNGSSTSGNYGEAAVRLNGGIVDFFIPDNTRTLTLNDWDFGAGGPLLIPNTGLLVGGGKTGALFVLNRTNLGHYKAGNTQVVQTWQATTACSGTSGAACHEIHHIAYWNRTGVSPMLYLWAWNEPLHAYAFNRSTFNTAPAAENSTIANYPGGILAVSANGSTPGTGILWAAMTNQRSDFGPVPGMLRAFDAVTLTELWNSTKNSADKLGLLAKFSAPTVVNGKVYMATFSNQLAVYGLH